MTEVAVEPYIAPSLMGRCRLIKIKGHTKVAVESGWQTKANYAPEDPDIISHISGGQNYGIMPTDGVIVIDCDTEEIYENLPAPWKSSLTVITGRDGAVGRHVFLDCPNSPHSKIVISKPVTLEPLGDIRGSDSPFYTVGAGSTHPDSGKIYHYVDSNAPLVAVDWSEVVTELIEKYGIKLAREMPVAPKQTTIASGGSLTDKLGLRIEDFAMPGNPVQRGNGDIQGSHPVHGSTTGMNFAINTSKNVWHCFPAGTLIQTPYGLKNIEDVLPDDEVFSESGAPQKVITTFDRDYAGEIIDIISPSGVVSVTPGHPILVARCPLCNKDYEGYVACKPNCYRRIKTKKQHCPGNGAPVIKWINSEDLCADTDFLVYQENLRYDITYNLKQYSTGKSKTTPDTLALNFDMATIIGWYLAEGHVAGRNQKDHNRLGDQKGREYTSGTRFYPAQSVQFTLSHSELEQANILKQLIKDNLGLSCTISQYPSRRTTHISCGSTIVASFFKDTFGTGSSNKTLGAALYSPTHILKNLLQSCFDGDGTIRPNSIRSRSYRTVSKKLAMEMHLGLLSLNKPSRIYTSPATTTISTIDKYKGRVYDCKELYSVNFTKNKREAREWYDEERYYLPITSITTRQFSGVVYNLETEDHTYQAPFIVHNCYRDNLGGDPVAWIAYSRCSVPETDCNHLTPDQFRDVKEWLKVNGYAAQLKKLDEDHFEAANSKLPKVDLSGILKTKATVKPAPIDSAEIEQAIAAARSRNLLPAFPEIDPGLFKDYVDLGKRVSYSLHEFHFAALLSIVSMALGRKVRIQVGMTDVYTNVFAMVVGHTTISGKSVACNMAINTIGKAIVHDEPIAKCYSTNIMRGTHSESGLVQAFNDTYHSLWYWDDCAGFFAEIGGWNAHILGTLCALYDGSPVELTLSRAAKKSTTPNKYSCSTPFLTMLFNTTTADIEEAASTKLFASGFFPRIMWFYGQGGQPRRNTITSDEDKQVFTQVYNDVKYLRDVVGTLPNDSIVFNVCDLIEDWKINVVANRLEKEDENYRTAVARGFIHMYKIAAILAMCDPVFQDTIFSNDLSVYPIIVNIPDNHAKAAIAIVEQYLVPRMMFVQEMCNHSDAKNHQVHVGKCLTSMGGTAERSKLLRRTHLSSKDLNLALGTMIESGEVKVYSDTKQGNDKPTMFIVKQI